MSDHTDSNAAPAKKGFAFAHLAFILAVLVPLFLIGVMMAVHVNLISDDLGIKTLTLGLGPKFAVVTLGIALISLLVSLFMAPGRCGPWALAAAVVAGVVLSGFYYYQNELRKYPPVADVSTNWDTPITFSGKLTTDRGPGAMAVEDSPRVPRGELLEWGGKSLAEINALTCPGAQPILHRHISTDQIAAMLEANKYILFGHEQWRVEATWQDNFYGLKSDMVIRRDPNRIDVRSTGRYDMPDLGANCRRVTDILSKIKALPDDPAEAQAVDPTPDLPPPSAQAPDSGKAQPGDDAGGDE